jgi:uncharacterized protein (TIGR00661 family)
MILHKPLLLYAIQATGNGHISRAKILIPHLEKKYKVDTVVSGSNFTLNPGFKVDYKLEGLSLFYSKCGGLDFRSTLLKNKISRAFKDARQLPVHNYDLVINDFDFVTSQACQYNKISSIHLGHQASFQSSNTPRPNIKSTVGEIVLKQFVKADKYIGFHFKKYDDFIMPPVIKEIITKSNPRNLGHITVYLPSINKECLIDAALKHHDIQFHWFDKEYKHLEQIKNITFYPIDNDLFTQSMIDCQGILTGGGFETPSEALYLGKNIVSVPIAKHYEQQCNGAALERLGVRVLSKLDENNFTEHINYLMSKNSNSPKLENCNILELLEKIEILAYN